MLPGVAIPCPAAPPMARARSNFLALINTPQSQFNMMVRTAVSLPFQSAEAQRKTSYSSAHKKERRTTEPEPWILTFSAGEAKGIVLRGRGRESGPEGGGDLSWPAASERPPAGCHIYS